MAALGLLRRDKLEINKGTLLLCYSETERFEEGEEYQVEFILGNGCVVLDKNQEEVLFKNIDEITDIFMIEKGDLNQ
jgi:hypothetical protein